MHFTDIRAHPISTRPADIPRRRQSIQPLKEITHRLDPIRKAPLQTRRRGLPRIRRELHHTHCFASSRSCTSMFTANRSNSSVSLRANSPYVAIRLDRSA